MAKFIKIKSGNHDVEMVTNNVKEPRSIILCLHGFNGDRWGDGFSKLKHSFEDVLICAFDSAGHGESEIDSLDMRIDLIIKEIDDVVEFLRSRYEDIPINLFAVSYGGYRAMLYLKQFGKKVENVILYNPAFKMLNILEIAKGFKYSELKEGDRIEMNSKQNKYISKYFLDDLKQNSVYVREVEIKNPITIFLGVNDTLVPRAHTLEFCEMYDVKLIEVSGAHNPSDENWREVIAYLEKNI